MSTTENPANFDVEDTVRHSLTAWPEIPTRVNGHPVALAVAAEVRKTLATGEPEEWDLPTAVARGLPEAHRESAARYFIGGALEHSLRAHARRPRAAFILTGEGIFTRAQGYIDAKSAADQDTCPILALAFDDGIRDGLARMGQAVRELHVSMAIHDVHGARQVCRDCHKAWPCPTERVVASMAHLFPPPETR